MMKNENKSDIDRRLLLNEPCVRWGNTFDVPLGGKNLKQECKSPSGAKVCCAAVDKSVSVRGIGIGYGDTGDVRFAKQSFGEEKEMVAIRKRKLGG